MRKVLLLIAALAVGGWLVRTSLFTVDRTEFVYLTQFGRPVATFDGADPGEAGLHVKWPSPIQSVQRLDRRLKYFGIEVVDIRLRRSNHPPAVREAIFARIRSERSKKVADYQSEGAKKAEDIKSDAERRVRAILAEARAQEQRIKGEADAEADHIRNQAHARDPQFYAFLK